MFRSILTCSVVSVVLSVCPTQSSFSADNGDGTYTNPPLYADFPDPDIIRVGDDFYMVSTTFMNSPGLGGVALQGHGQLDDDQQRRSTDSNWQRSAIRHGRWHPLPKRHLCPVDSLQQRHFLRRRAAQRVSGKVPLQIYHTQDPAGEWQLNQLNVGAFDPGLVLRRRRNAVRRLWRRLAGQYLHPAVELQTSPASLGGEQVIHNAGFGLEGAHVIKRDGYYYIFNSRPGQLAMYVSRSTNLFSGWQTQPSVSDALG